jgi:hypothetical protein
MGELPFVALGSMAEIMVQSGKCLFNAIAGVRAGLSSH